MADKAATTREMAIAVKEPLTGAQVKSMADLVTSLGLEKLCKSWAPVSTWASTYDYLYFSKYNK